MGADLLLRPKPTILNPTNPAPPVARRLRRLRRLRLLTTGHHECRSTGQDHCRAPQGSVINHKTVQTLMEELQLKSLVRLKKYRSYRGQVGQVAPNLIDRDFDASRPNEKWVTDVTEFKVDGQRLYLSPVMDLFNGEILAYTTARRPLFNMIGSMLSRAFSRLGPDDRPVLHSDQGWQYQMEKYRQRLDERAITQSMSRKGNCLDNAAMESFFGTLKSEFFHLNEFLNLEELKAGLGGYIRYYNRDRIRLKLNGLSPIEYRQRFTENLTSTV